jgi:hypothetical protein
MSKPITLLAVLLLFFSSNCFLIQSKTAINWPFTVCGTGPWKMTTLTMSGTPSRNMNDDITAVISYLCQTGTVNSYVEFDHVELDVKLNGLFLHSESIAYNKVYDKGDILTFKYTNFVPSFAPAGNYLLTFVFKDKAMASTGCFSMTFKL